MGEPLLTVENLSKTFERKGRDPLIAVNDVSFTVDRGECVGLVGGSGSGKSTIAHIITRLTDASNGSITLDGRDVTFVKGAELRALARDVQMVFQNPVSSFDPRRTLGYSIAECLRNLGMGKAAATDRTRSLLERCGLPPVFEKHYPHEVSGGQCQRAAIARALAPSPSLIICDEATSALDVTVQAQIIDLLRSVREESGTAFLFICHDLALVQGFCDRVLVMQAGHIVEAGPAADVLARPQHPYTRQLVDAVL